MLSTRLTPLVSFGINESRFVLGLDEGKVWVLPFLWVVGPTLSRVPW